MAETDVHRNLMFDLIGTLEDRYENDRMVYVSGNLLVFYHEGDKRKHVAPDVFVVDGVEKRTRDHYLIWEERRGPRVVIELTSRSTKREDIDKKFRLYEQELRVPEYFLFDPSAEYLRPPQRGYRLRGNEYAAIRPVEGRLPSKFLGLHLERDGTQLRLFDPALGRRLPTPAERLRQIRAEKRLAELEIERERATRLETEAEMERLRRELDALRRGGSRKD
jgi:Uma2 family endonuclease